MRERTVQVRTPSVSLHGRHDSSAPKVSILLPTKNAGPLLDRVLTQVFAQRTDFAYEMIVVDSGSTDDTLGILAKYPVKLYHIPPHEFNHGATRNLLATLARGEYFAYITQDAVPDHDDWLANLVAPLMRGDAVGAYARQLPRVDTDPINSFFLGEIYPKESRTQYLNGRGLTLDTVRFSNASSAMTRAAWTEVPFRGDIIMAEDQDWSVRALRKGGRIAYVAEARVEHAHHYTLKETFKRYFDSGVSYREIYQMGKSSRTFFPEFFINGFRHVWKKARTLAAEGHARWIPKAMAVSAVKGAAVVLGRNHRFLPTKLKVKCSWHKYHWTTRSRPGGLPGAAVTLSISDPRRKS